MSPHMLGLLLSICICFFAETSFAQKGRLPPRIRLDLNSEFDGIRSSTIREVLEDYSFEDLKPYLESDYQPLRISILEELVHRPILLHDYRDIVFELIDDRDTGVAKQAMSLCARFLYHDKFTQRLSPKFFQLLEHENFEISLHALTVCVDYGLHPAAVVKKLMELVVDERFRETDFYSNFVTSDGFCIEGILEERAEILDLALREVLSDHSARRNLAISILTRVNVADSNEWVKIFEALKELPESQASEIILSRLVNEKFRKVIKQHPSLEQKLEKHLQRMVQSYPEEVAFYRLQQAKPSENVEPWLETLSASSLRSLSQSLEKRDMLPGGTTLYLRRDIFDKAPELIPIWKELHPDSASRLDKVFVPQSEEHKQFGDFSYLMVSLFDDVPARLPESEIPFLQKMFESNKQSLHRDAIVLFFHMGLAKYEPASPSLYPTSPLRAEVEQALSHGLKYSPRAVRYLERLLKHPNDEVRLHALAMLMCSGQWATEYHSRILHAFLDKALAEKAFDNRCLLAIKLLPYLKSHAEKGEEVLLSIIRSQRQDWNNQPTHCACFTCVPYRNTFLEHALDSLAEIPHRNDEWLKELALLFLRGNSNSNGHWEYLCANFLATTPHKSSSAAELLWISYQMSDHKELRFEDEESDQLTNQLRIAVNLSRDPKLYLKEWIRYFDSQFIEYLEDERGLDDIYELPELLTFANCLHDHPESWSLLKEQSGRAFLKRLCELLILSNRYAPDDVLPIYFSLFPCLEEVYPENPLRNYHRMTQHELLQSIDVGNHLYGTNFPMFVWKSYRSGDFLSDIYRPLMLRISRSMQFGVGTHSEALLILSVIEPDNEEHWNNLVKLAEFGQIDLDEFRIRREKMRRQ